MKDIIYIKRYFFVTVVRQSFKFVNIIEKEESYIPIEDVDMFIFDHPRSYFSNKLIEVCIKNDIAILFCNSKHQPITSVFSNFGYQRRLKRLLLQMKVQKKTKDRIWKKIIVCKIKNQSDCLRYTAELIDEADFIEKLTGKIENGDQTNREAFAAKRYFNSLYGNKFIRGRYDDAVNASLNYGYALIRAKIRKSLATYGFEQSFGIHHRSTENPFNLSDDIIEVFRPFVDSYVYEFIYQKNVVELSTEHKEQLIALLFENCVIDERITTIFDSIDIVIQSLIVCYENNSASFLKLPKMIEEGA